MQLTTTKVGIYQVGYDAHVTCIFAFLSRSTVQRKLPKFSGVDYKNT